MFLELPGKLLHALRGQDAASRLEVVILDLDPPVCPVCQSSLLEPVREALLQLDRVRASNRRLPSCQLFELNLNQLVCTGGFREHIPHRDEPIMGHFSIVIRQEDAAAAS